MILKNLSNESLNWTIEIINLLEQSILNLFPFSKNNIYNLIETANSFIQFSINDYFLYKKYNHVVISMACILITFNNEIEENLELKNKNTNKEKIKILFKDFNDFIDFSLIKKCSEDIINNININLDEENGQEENINTKDNSTEIQNDFNDNNKFISKNILFT